MGCVQTKATQPEAAANAPDTVSELPTLLRKTRTGVADVGKGLTKGAVGAVSAVGSGAVGAASAVGTGVTDVGKGLTKGAVGAVNVMGKGLSSLTGQTASDSQDSGPKEQSVFERLCSLDPFACCCQSVAADGNLLGSLVKTVLANFDSSMLGVKVEVGDLNLDPTTGRVEVAGLTVHNPEGYHSEHLLHADRVVLDIDMQKLLYSFGKEIDVEEMVFDGVDVIYEKSLMSSNLNDLLKKLSDSEQDADAKAKEDKQDVQKEDDVKLILHTILAQNIGAKLATKLTRGHGLRLEVGDLSYQDFDTEMGAGRGMMDIIRVLIMTLIKSVLATVLGKENTKAISGAANGAKDGLKNACHGSTEKLKMGCSKVWKKASSSDEITSAPSQSQNSATVTV